MLYGWFPYYVYISMSKSSQPGGSNRNEHTHHTGCCCHISYRIFKRPVRSTKATKVRAFEENKKNK